MNKSFKKKLAVMALGIGLLGTGSLAQAGTTYESYSVIVPGFNDLNNIKPWQDKATSSKDVNLKVTTLGKAMDARATGITTAGRGPWVRLSTTGTFNLPNTISKGSSTSVQFSSDLSQIVDAKVAGTWRSN